MADIISAIGDIITAAFVGTSGANPTPSWISTALSTITSNPLILIAVLIPFIGIGIGLLKRLFGTRA